MKREREREFGGDESEKFRGSVCEFSGSLTSLKKLKREILSQCSRLILPLQTVANLRGRWLRSFGGTQSAHRGRQWGNLLNFLMIVPVSLWWARGLCSPAVTLDCVLLILAVDRGAMTSVDSLAFEESSRNHSSILLPPDLQTG